MTRMKVLIVEDDEDMRRLAGLILSRASFEIVGEVSDGAAGVAAVETLRPHLVVMDLEMPVMDGAEATRRIKASHPEVVVIGLTSAAEEGVERMITAGAAAVVEKSDLGDVVAVVEAWSPRDQGRDTRT